METPVFASNLDNGPSENCRTCVTLMPDNKCENEIIIDIIDNLI